MRAREATDHSASGRKASSAKQPKNKKDIRSPRMASLPPERRQTDPPHGYKQPPPTDHASAASETEIGGGGSSFCKCVSVEAPARAAHSGTLSITRGLLYARGGGLLSSLLFFFWGRFLFLGRLGQSANQRQSGSRAAGASPHVQTESAQKGVRAAVHPVREKREESNDLLSPDSRAFSLYLVSKFGIILRSTIRALSTIAVRLQQPVEFEP